MKRSAIHSAMAFGVTSVGKVDGYRELDSVRICFPYDKPCTSIPLQLMTGKSALEVKRFKVEVVNGVQYRYFGRLALIIKIAA
jgi:hypothetical protein